MIKILKILVLICFFILLIAVFIFFYSKKNKDIQVDINIKPSAVYGYVSSVENDIFYQAISKKSFNLSVKSEDLFAQDVMYIYLREIFKISMQKQSIISLPFNKEDIWAISYDLDGDNVSEILGYYQNDSFCHGETYPFFILKKFNGKYIDIYRGEIPFDISKIVILGTKTNAFFDLAFVKEGGFSEERVYDLVIYNETGKGNGL